MVAQRRLKIGDSPNLEKGRLPKSGIGTQKRPGKLFPFDHPAKETLACQMNTDLPLRFNSEAWSLENLPYFRRLGFFADLPHETDDKVLAVIRARHADEYSAPWRNAGKTPPAPPAWEIKSAPPLADLYLLGYDTSRVWWEDTECVYPPEYLSYRDAIARWSAISRGALSPIDIREQWGGTDDEPEDPVVQIVLDNGVLTLTPIFDGDYLDLTVLTPINAVLARSDIQLELYKAFDQTAFVVALTAHEKRQLETERGWEFQRLPQ